MKRILLAVFTCVALYAEAPSPMIDASTKVDWWFVFKFNTASFPNSCPVATRKCPFGGAPEDYTESSQQFAFASSANPQLKQGGACLGESTADPVGATFDELYNGKLNYVVWNDQFYNDPLKNAGTGTGHSKGMLAWDSTGAGFVMQVSTPDWPGSGNSKAPRKTDGNTLGCIPGDNDIKVSQHFFALKLNKADVVAVLKALANASVVTDPKNKQIVKNGGPANIQAIVKTLGTKTKGTDVLQATLSSGVAVISKPAALNVPPWQMVSSILGGTPLLAATWWESSAKLPDTKATDEMGCWDPSLTKHPGAVVIAHKGTWQGSEIGLDGGSKPAGNHAKIGVSTGGTHPYAIFGDMNQEGSISDSNCKKAQNVRGGMFFVVENQALHDAVHALISSHGIPTN